LTFDVVSDEYVVRDMAVLAEDTVLSNHALRHTAATLGYLHTGGPRAVQELLGHCDPRMTSRYAHVVDMPKRNPALFIPIKVG
jgi:integrase